MNEVNYETKIFLIGRLCLPDNRGCNASLKYIRFLMGILSDWKNKYRRNPFCSSHFICSLSCSKKEQNWNIIGFWVCFPAAAFTYPWHTYTHYVNVGFGNGTNLRADWFWNWINSQKLFKLKKGLLPDAIMYLCGLRCHCADC